jgi:hypothetical protein
MKVGGWHTPETVREREKERGSVRKRTRVRHPEGWDTNRKPTLPKGVAGTKPTLPKGVVGTNQNQHSRRVLLEQKHLKPTSAKRVAGTKPTSPKGVAGTKTFKTNNPEGCGWNKNI